MRKRMGARLTAALLLALATACLAQGGQEEDGLRLWFAVPAAEQSREVSAALSSCPYGGEESVSALLAALLAGPPQDSGLIRAIPEGTRAVRWAVENRTAQVELSEEYAALAGLLLIGLGCAPIYPCIIHSTPAHFGAEKSQAIIGVQMASAYLGTCLMPPLFGLIANHITVSLFPFYLLAILILMVFMHEALLKSGGNGG